MLFSFPSWLVLPVSLSFHWLSSLYFSQFLIAIIAFMGLNVDDSQGCGEGPRAGRNEEMKERGKRDWGRAGG